MAEQTFILKLSDGEDVKEGLESLAKEREIDYGFITSVSGKIKDFEMISSSSQGALENMVGKDEYEVNSISGKIEKSRGIHSISVKASISKTGFIARSGELLYAKAAGNLEIGVKKMNMKKIIYA